MRKMIRWYLLLILLAAVCVLGVWAVSSRSKEPTNATLVWSTMDSRKQSIPKFRGQNSRADAEIRSNVEMGACGL